MNHRQVIEGILNDLLEEFDRTLILDGLAEWIKETSDFEDDLVDYEKLEKDVLEEVL